jgi:hypothetical protein
LRSADPNAQNGLAIVVAGEPGGPVKLFEINILMSKSPVSNILPAEKAIEMRQLSSSQYFAEIDEKKI